MKKSVEQVTREAKARGRAAMSANSTTPQARRIAQMRKRGEDILFSIEQKRQASEMADNKARVVRKLFPPARLLK